MTGKSIEREVLIQAPAETVWRVITEPEHIGRWFSDEAELEQRAGADGALRWLPGARGGSRDGMTVPIRVVEAEPHSRFSFRWGHEQGTSPDEGTSALVEFVLTSEGEGTRLLVVESGIEAVTDGVQDEARYRAEHEHGWERHLGELLDHVAAAEPAPAG